MPYGLDTPVVRGLSGASGLNTPLTPVGPVPGGFGAGELERGLHRGLSTIANTGQATLGQLVQPLAPDAGSGLIQGAINDQNAMGQQYAPAVPTWDDVHGLYDTALYGAGKFGEMAPLMPLGMGAAGVGRLAGGLAGSELGAAAAFMPLNMGDEAMRLHQDPTAAGMTPGQKLLHSGTVGGIQSLLEGAVPAGAIDRYATHAAVPRSLGAAARGLAGDFVKGTAAGSAEEVAQDLVSQAGQFAYNPNAQFDPEALKETAIGSAFGMAPMAGAHAVTAAATDAVGGGALKGLELGKKAGDAAITGAQIVGKAAYDALSPEAQARLDKVAAVAKSPKEVYDFAKGLATDTKDGIKKYADSVVERQPDTGDTMDNLGNRATQVANDAAEAIGNAAQDAGLYVKDKLEEGLHAVKSPEGRLQATIDKMASFTGAEEPEVLTQRRDFLAVLAQRYSNTAKGATIQKAADAVDQIINFDPAQPKAAERAQGLRDMVRRAARALSEEVGGKKLTEARTITAKWLATQKGSDGQPTHFSMHMPWGEEARKGASPASQYDNLKMKDHEVAVSKLSSVLDRAFAMVGLTGPEWANERARMGKMVQAYAEARANGDDFHTVLGDDSKPLDVPAAVRAELQHTFKGETGKVHAAIEAVINYAKQGNQEGMLSAKEPLFDFISSKIKPGVTASEMHDLVLRADKNITAMAGSKGVALKNLEPGLRARVTERKAYDEEHGMPEQTAHDLAMEILQQEATDQLRAMMKTPDGSVLNSIIQRVREMDHTNFGDVRKEMNIRDHGDNVGLNASEMSQEGDAEGNDAEGKKVNEDTGLTAAPNMASADVQDTDHKGNKILPATGHETSAHGVGGEIGHRIQEEKMKSAPVAMSPQKGKSPARSDGSGHVEVGRINALEHVESMGEPNEQDNILQDWHIGIRAKEAENAEALRKELAAMGVSASDAVTDLKAEYNRSSVQHKIAKSDGTPWEAFDARKKLSDPKGAYRMTTAAAQKTSDLFWAEVRRDYDDSPREFFTKFKHSFVTTRNNAGGHERMTGAEINRGILTNEQVQARGITRIDNTTGYLMVTKKNGEEVYLDVPELLKHSLGKVRTRAEGFDETGARETYDDNLIMPDGSLNARYATDLRAAWAAFAVSTIDSDRHTVTPETAEFLLNPPKTLLLVRGEKGKGNVTWADATAEAKKIRFTTKQRAQILPTAPQASGVAALGKGVLPANIAEPVTSGGNPVSVDFQALIRHTAAALGVNMTDAPRQVYFAMLKEGIRTLKTSEMVDGESLRQPVSYTKGSTVLTLHDQYEGLVIGDRTYRTESGDLVSGEKDTLVKLTGGMSQDSLYALYTATRLDTDATSRSLSLVAGLAAVLESKLAEQRGDTKPTLDHVLMNSIGIELDGIVKLAAGRSLRGMDTSAEDDRAHALNDKIARLGAKIKAEGSELFGKSSEAFVLSDKEVEEKLTRAEQIAYRERKARDDAQLARMSRDEAEEYARDGKPKFRASLEKKDVAASELLAKLRNIIDVIHEKSGWAEDAFEATDGTLGTHVETEQNVKRTEAGTTDFSDADTADGGKLTKKVTVPLMQDDANDTVKRAGTVTAGKKLERVDYIDKNGKRITESKEEFAARKKEADAEGAKQREADRKTVAAMTDSGKTKAAATVAEAPLKADPKLQAFLEQIKNGKNPRIANVGDHMMKAWHDEAGKLPKSDARDFAMQQLRNFAEDAGVDIATGKYKTDEATSTKEVWDEDGASVGTAEVKLNSRSELEMWQNDKRVGIVMDRKIAETVRQGGSVLANITSAGADFEAELSYFGASKAMPEYDGANNLPPKKSRAVGGKVEGGKAVAFENKSYNLNKVLQGELESNGRAGEIRYNTGDRMTSYSAEAFADKFGPEALRALENALAAKADGATPNPLDMAKLSPPALGKAAATRAKSAPERAKVTVKVDTRDKAAKEAAAKYAEPTTNYSRLVVSDDVQFEGMAADQVVDYFNMLFNAKVASHVGELKDAFGNLVAGKTVADKNSPLGFLTTISRGARSLMGSTAMHEALHGLFRVLNNERSSTGQKEAYAALQRSLTGAVVQQRLANALDAMDMPEAQLKTIKDAIAADPEEAAAYAFQFWRAGDLKLGPAGDGFFTKAAKFLRNLVGITTEYERSDAFMTAFLKGDLGKADFKASALETAFAAKKGDEMLKVIGEHLEPFKQVMNTVFDSSVKAMERLNLPEATDLMRKFTGYGGGEGYIKRVNIESRKASTKAGAILGNHKTDELAAGIKEIYDGKITSAAGKDIMAFVDDMNAYAGRPKGTLPTIFDHAKISKDRKAFDRAIDDFGVKTKGVDNRAVLDLISDLGFQLREGDKVDFLPQYANEKAKWMQNDPTMFMRSLIVSSVKKTEYGKIFKPGEVQETLQKIQAKGGNEAYHKAKQFVDGMEGRLGQNMNPGVRNMMKAVLTAGNVVTLPFSIFSAAVDPFHLASRSNSLGEAGNAYAKGISSVFRTVGEMFGAKHDNTPEENLAEEIGAIEHAMMVDVLGDTYLGDQAEGLTKKINDWFFKANMLDGWTRQMRVAAVTSGQRFILEHSDVDSKNKHSAHFMEELGLAAGDVVKDSEGNLVLNDKVKMALNKFVDESIVRPDQATNAIWMNDPRFMLLAHMKRFTYAFNDVVLARAMKEAHRGNLSPIAMLGASIPAILAADMGKHLLKGDYDTWMNNSSTSQWFDLGMNRAGLNGKMQFGMDAVHDVEMGGTPIDSAMGPDIGLVKKMFGAPHHSVAGSDMGLLGLADDAAMLAYQGTQLEGARQEKHKKAA